MQQTAAIGIAMALGCAAWGHPGHGVEASAGLAADSVLHQRTDRLAGATNQLLAIARESHDHEAFADALAAADAWAAADPGSVAARIARSRAMLGAHRFPEALLAAREAAALASADAAGNAPGTLPGGVYAEAQRCLFDAILATGDAAGALAIAEGLLESGIDVPALTRMGLAHLEGGHFAPAASWFADAAEACRLQAAPNTTLAWCHTMRAEAFLELGDLTSAEHACRESLRLDPQGVDAARLAIRVHAAMGRLDCAIGSAEALSNATSHPRDRIALAHLLRRRASADDHARADAMLADAETVLTTEALGGRATGSRNDRSTAAGHAEPSATSPAGTAVDPADEIVSARFEHAPLHARELIELWISEQRNLEAATRLADLELDRTRTDATAHELAAFARLRGPLLHEPDRAVRHARLALRTCGDRSRTQLRCGLVLHAAGHSDEATDALRAGLIGLAAIEHPELAERARAMVQLTDHAIMGR